MLHLFSREFKEKQKDSSFGFIVLRYQYISIQKLRVRIINSIINVALPEKLLLDDTQQYSLKIGNCQIRYKTTTD